MGSILFARTVLVAPSLLDRSPSMSSSPRQRQVVRNQWRNAEDRVAVTYGWIHRHNQAAAGKFPHHGHREDTVVRIVGRRRGGVSNQLLEKIFDDEMHHYEEPYGTTLHRFLERRKRSSK